MRTPKKNKSVVDLSKPINIGSLEGDNPSCFGEEWDIAEQECSYCADNDVCGILFSNKVSKKVVEVEKRETTFLDLSDFGNIDQSYVMANIDGITANDFIDMISKLANTEDTVAVVEWIKRFITNSSRVSITNKIVTVTP